MNLLEKAKEWFKEETEADVDLMISSGVITEDYIIDMYRRDAFNLGYEMDMKVPHKVVQEVKDNDGNPIYVIFCPGCKRGHGFDKRWSFNGNFEKPTFSPSMLVNQSIPKRRCHSFVENGKIRFLGDCFHEYKNQTIDLEEF